MPYNVLGAGSAGGYEIEQSLKFNNTGDVSSLSRTPSVDGNKQVATLSFWAKNCGVSTAAEGATAGTAILVAGTNNTNKSTWSFSHENPTFFINNYRAGPGNGFWTTNAVYRDPNAWYHFVISYNQGTVVYYVNGEVNTHAVTIGGWSGAVDTAFNDAGELMVFGPNVGTTSVKSIYLAELHWIDGQALNASDFGETNPITNQWIPKKYVGTYGTNGLYLDFANSANFGQDKSGNGNNLTATGLTATDQVLDSPTNNFCTLQSNMQVIESSGTYSEGNLSVSKAGNFNVQHDSTIRFNSGKWYWEVLVNQMASPTSNYYYIGTQNHVWASNGDYYDQGTPGWVAQGVTFSQGDLIGIAVDYEGQTIKFYKNGSLTLDKTLYPEVIDYFSARGRINGNGGTAENIYNFGQDSSFAGTKTAQGNKDANGKGDFYYAPPSGYLALCEDNLSDPSIALPGDHFEAVVYVGDGNSTQEVTTNFQPDLIWNKNRTTGYHHRFFDRVRGLDKSVYSNNSSAEDTYQDYGYPTATSSTSVTVGQGDDSNNLINLNNQNYVMWNWKADNTSGSSNTDGTITSTVSANPTAGFSIVSYTGNGVDNSSIGHGLSQAPELIILKKRATSAENWPVYHKDLTSGYELFLNLTNAQADDVNNATWGDNHPGGITSSVFEVGYAGDSNANTDTFIAYCFHSVEGYSKIGSYTANGSADGPFVYTGFTPAFIIFKNTSAVEAWSVFDIKRNPINGPDANMLLPSSTATESSTANRDIDFVSNGFKLRSTALNPNTTSGNTYIYMAFAESPFKYSNAR